MEVTQVECHLRIVAERNHGTFVERVENILYLATRLGIGEPISDGRLLRRVRRL